MYCPICVLYRAKCRVGGLWELLYADDLALTAETQDEVELMFGEWRQAVERRGLKANLEKTKMMVTGGEVEDVVRVGRYPCGVCGHGVGANSVLCTACGKWCHKRCSGRGCLRQRQCLFSGARHVLGAVLGGPLMWGVVLLVR